jgi:ferric-dicitrate binding protein FerR (iron transport regulator)
MIGRRRVSRWRVVGGVFAAAAALTMVAGALWYKSGSVTDGVAMLSGEGFGEGVMVSDGTNSRTLVARGALQAGERVVASETGWGTIDLQTGSRLVVEHSSAVLIDRADQIQRFALDRGSLRADVAKLHKGERFVISTADTEVEVRGTSFRVWVAPADPTCFVVSQTRVAVYEGVVRVRHGSQEVEIARGGHWPDCGQPLAARTTPPHAVAEEPPMARISRESPRPVRPRSVSMPIPMEAAAPSVEEMPTPASTLAAQNRLFRGANIAARRGQNRAALAMYQRLEDLYPDGPLAEPSVVERFRLLKSEDAKAARDLAERYLARFPAGFARSEARELSRR